MFNFNVVSVISLNYILQHRKKLGFNDVSLSKTGFGKPFYVCFNILQNLTPIYWQ